MFFEPSLFPFSAVLESSWRKVRAEFDRLPPECFREWHEKHLYTNKWMVYGLYGFGKKHRSNCLACPETCALLEKVPGLVTAGFSLLMPGTVIKPHKGYSGAVLRCHLGLRVEEPATCVLKVAGTERHWEEGKCLVFDDTSEHEAWNRGSSPRAVLLLDFVNPLRSIRWTERARLSLLSGPARLLDSFYARH